VTNTSEARLKMLADASFEAIFLSEKGVCIDQNLTAEKMFGYIHAEAVGRQAIEWIVPEDRELVKRNIMSGYEKPYEITGLCKDGTTFPCEIQARMTNQQGQSIRITALRDISERNQVVEENARLQSRLRQSKKMEAIGTLAGGIAHDFNNILGVIIGYADMANDDAPADSQLSQDLDKILQAGHRAKDLVKQILAFSRQAQVEKIPMNLQPIIKEALKMLRSAIPTTIEIKENIHSDCGLIDADPTQIYQIVMNLCTNAFHAMEETGGVLTIELKTAGHIPYELQGKEVVETDFIELVISDTGCGIDPDIIHTIFDPFFTTKETGKGTGMGLAITYGIVEEYGGQIFVESKRGRGTTLYLCFPKCRQEKKSSETTTEKATRGKERILFVDDEELLVDLGKTMLKRLGYQVVAKQSSLQALELFKNQPDHFDLGGCPRIAQRVVWVRSFGWESMWESAYRREFFCG